MNHFNPSLSAVKKWRNSEVVKAKLKLTVTFAMTDGQYHRSRWSTQATIIRRTDVEHIHDYAEQNCTPRDYLIVRLPMKVGLRTGEIASFRVENINFDDRSFKVLDSKQKILYPLPLDIITLQLIQDLVRERLEGYVFTRSRSWKHVKSGQPLSVQEIWHIIRKVGLAAGVQGVKPRMFRQYFVANWVLRDKSDSSKKMLQLMLRHVYSSTTDIYADNMIFPEDLQEAYDRVQGGPFVLGSICNDCSSYPCPSSKNGPLPSCVEGCRFKQKREELKI
jgi:integrase